MDTQCAGNDEFICGVVEGKQNGNNRAILKDMHVTGFFNYCRILWKTMDNRTTQRFVYKVSFKICCFSGLCL